MEAFIMEQWLKLGEKLRALVNPATLPVAVKFLKEPSEIPPGARRPLKDLGVRMAPCQGAGMTRRYGWTLAFAKEDVGCAIAANSYGWERVKNEEGVIAFLTYMNYAGSPEAAREVLKGFRNLDMDENLVVVYSPLERTKVEPDVVLIYVNPAQLMRLIHGATVKSGKPIESHFSGRAASCTEGVIGAFLDQNPKVVVPGNGDRVWGGCQDHEVAMAVPATRLDELIEGLRKTHERGVRYPIPTYLRYEPQVGIALPLSDIFNPKDLTKFKS
jgi:uncharacterized protein (DUF169 family)